MTETYFHVGVLVYDIDEALKRFCEVLSLDFTPPQRRGPLTNGDTVRAAYSLQGPPYLELIEAIPRDGIFATSQGEGIHHIGLWDDDMGGRCEFLASQALAPAPLMNSRGGVPLLIMTDPDALHGVRLEYTDGRNREQFLDRWTGR